ncbi:MAG: hypothetical protein ACOYMA_11705 [Bacteroidia bacterium]
MSNIKIITVAFFIGLFCLNADCNKVEEKPPITDFFIIEGRLVNSCTDNSPIKNSSFDLVGYNYAERLSTTTDSNGYFKFYSKFKDKTLLMRESSGRYILSNLPGSKNLNIGNIAYNFTIPVTFKYKNFTKLSYKDSLFIEVQGVYGNTFVVKGPITSENIGQFNIKADPIYDNKSLSNSFVFLYKNNFENSNLIQKKDFVITPCGTNQEIIFE